MAMKPVLKIPANALLEVRQMNSLLKLTVAAVIVALIIFPGAAAAEVTSKQVLPVDFTGFVPCANGGVGEEVHIIGEVQTMTTLTIDGSGGAHVTVRGNYIEGVTGTGLSSGDAYRGVGVFSITLNWDPETGFPLSRTHESLFQLIGEGSNNNLVVFGVVHVTVGPDGVPRSDVTQFHIECR